MKRLERAIRTRFYPSIVQCSPVRTGSTLVWNALKAMFPGVEIPKRHDLNVFLRSPLHPCRIVATVRDPRDVVVSMLALSGEEMTSEGIIHKLHELDRHGLLEMRRIRNRPRTLILRYEDIYRDYSRLFSLLGDFFDLRVNKRIISDFESRFHIENVMRKSKRLGGFETFDPEDQIHGGHVSDRKGEPGGYRLVLDDASCRLIESHCSEFMEAFGYSS